MTLSIRSCLLMLMVLLFSGCAPRHPNVASLPPKPLYTKIKQHRPVPTFTQIDAQGRLNLRLHTGYKKPQVILTGDARDLLQVRVQVLDGTLYLSLGNGFPQYGEVSADIRTTSLTRLHYIGAGIIKGMRLHTHNMSLIVNNQGPTQLGGSIGLRQLVVDGGGVTQMSGVSSPYLDVRIHGNSKVQLNGVANLAILDVEGNGELNLYWVKSKSLKITAKKGERIQLAGIVDKLEVELWGRSQFKGRYLRAQRSFVKTHDKSLAEIASVHHQSTLATDASDILYYNLPTTRADFMGFNGAVLDMRDWNLPDLKDFTWYNKQFP